MKKIYLMAFCLGLLNSAISVAAPKIILKLDDLSVKQSICSCSPTFDYLMQKQLKAGFGAIASRLDSTSLNTLKPYLNATNAKGEKLFEIWHHGLDHVRPEFQTTSYEYQKAHFDQSDELIKKLLGIQMHTFGTPFNASDSITNKVISENPNYKIFLFSSQKPRTPNGITYFNNRTDMENGTGNPEFDFFLKNYTKNKAKYTDYMVLQGHPNIWTPEKLEQFKKIVDFLISEGCEFVLPYEQYLGTSWQSKYIQQDKGRVTAVPDEKGNIIPDFSRVGYHQGNSEIPGIQVKKTISAPLNGDSQDLIQKAIDELAALPPDAHGFRGAILLKKGIYQISGSLKINKSGIILRGEGDTETGTVLIASGKKQRSLVVISGTGSRKEIQGSRTKIADAYVPVGSFSFSVNNAQNFRVGDQIVVYRPSTERWIKELKMDQIEARPGTKQWKAGDYDLNFERTITKIEGNKIVIDNPIVMAMDEKYGGGEIYKYTFEGRIAENGVENILFKSAYLSETDEDHGWYAVEFDNCENGWVRNVTSRYFGNGCVLMSDGSKYITVTNSGCFDAKSVITGGRRYSFNINGQMCLVMNCETTEGRHDFVTGARVCGPNVFYNCKAKNTHADIGPHHRWCVGTLYDNITSDGQINIQDRGNMGSGHGWSGANQVLWNCTASQVAVQNPWVSAKNWCIGLTGKKYPGHFNDRPDGVWEGLNKPGLQPQSLYQAQLIDRKQQK